MQRGQIPIRLCRSIHSPQISLPCSDAQPSMRRLARPAPSSPRSTTGGCARRSTKLGPLEGARRRSHFGNGHLSRRVPGTNRFLSTRASGKSAVSTASCSKSGPAHAGPGGSVHTLARDLPDGFQMGSPSLVHKGDRWWLHTPIEKKFEPPAKIVEQLMTDQTRICAVDRNLDQHLAVCSVQTVDGPILASSFIGKGAEIAGTRREIAWPHCTQPTQDGHYRRRRTGQCRSLGQNQARR